MSATSYCVRCTFAAPTDIADPAFLIALEAAGLLRLREDVEVALSFDLLPPGGLDGALSGAWASVTAERLNELGIAWTVEPVCQASDDRRPN